MEYQTIIFEKHEKIATITLDKPEKRNAVDEIMGDELVDCLIRCEEDSDIRSIILTGGGKVFCSGGDLNMSDFFSQSPQLGIKKLLNRSLPAFQEIRRISKPVIAAVNGPAIGGGFALALACDLVIASKNANFCSQYVQLGMSPDAGVTSLLPKLIGDKRAAWLMFTGEKIHVESAYDLGLINEITEQEALLTRANEMAERLANSATLAIGSIKKLINLGSQDGLETQMEHEKQAMSTLASTKDVKEAITAFSEKRMPVFKGE